ncbi:MAG TPA: hypothetical protein PK490_22020 [Prosthecobacter sp.]|nr:hypothetical protein [Prosthecobacter sp.]HRK16975.1 hypothetical protein [Prosthecobacter sp.]
MSDRMQQIIQTKDAERRRLRELPWLEKLDMLTQAPPAPRLPANPAETRCPRIGLSRVR